MAGKKTFKIKQTQLSLERPFATTGASRARSPITMGATQRVAMAIIVLLAFLLVISFLHPFARETSYATNSNISVGYSGSDWVITAPTSTAADAGGLEFDIESNSAGVNMAKKDIVTGGSTNVPDYQIYVSVNTAGGKIPATSGSAYVDATAGTVTDATADVSGAAALSNNSWGFALPSFNTGINYDDLVSSSSSSSWSSSKWSKLPYIATASIEDESTVESTATKIYDSTTSSTDSVDVYYAVNANNDLASGEYQTTVTYTLIGEMPAPAKTYMQDMTASDCAALDTFDANNADATTYTVYDSRDESDYTIRKLADGHCWMAQNFRMTKDTLSANDHSATLDSSDTDISSSKSPSTFEMPNNVKWSGSSSQHLLKGAADATKLPVGSSSGTPASGETAVARGAYYSWCTATADCTNDVTTGVHQENSICPKGWRLANPNNGSSSNDNEYYKLYNSYGSASSFNQAFNTYYSSGANYYLAGNWWANSGSQYVRNAGSSGYWWSSTSHSSGADGAWFLVASTSGVTPADSNYRYYGYSVRCML